MARERDANPIVVGPKHRAIADVQRRPIVYSRDSRERTGFTGRSFVTPQTIFAPAKLNLFLAITGRRADGFHDLVSVVAPLTLGDTLSIEPAPAGTWALQCSDPEVPTDDTNLVLKAARAFVVATHWRGGATFILQKRIPMGAGLGGGSSNGVAALRGLNAMAGMPLNASDLAALAATLGSDCPLFLHDGPVVMRGRGERIEPMPANSVARVRGRRVLVFKPAFGIATAWAYKRLAEMAAEAASSTGEESPYLPAAAAESRVNEWLADPHADLEGLLFNTLERPAFEKYLAIPALLERLRAHGVRPLMTGSGSACFALLPDQVGAEQIGDMIRHAWGDSAFVADTRIA